MNTNEAELIRLIFLLADTQTWLNDLFKNAMLQLPVSDKKKLAAKTYFLTPTALAHILEKNHQPNRFPLASKFTVPLTQIMELLRNAAATEPQPITGTLNNRRVISTVDYIGINGAGQPVQQYCVITGPGGDIITAFPI